MKVLYDLLCTQARGDTWYNGGAEYGKAIFMELAQNLNDDVDLTVFYNSRLELDKNVLETVSSKNIQYINIKNAEELTMHLFEQNYDLFFSAIPTHYVNDIITAPCIYAGVLHDVRALEIIYDSTYKYYLPKLNFKNIKGHIFAHTPSYSLLHRFISKIKLKRDVKVFEKIIESLDIVITVSDHSKYSMLYFLSNAKEKNIRVYYTPQKNINTLSISDENKFGDYVLLVSVNRYVKNAINAIKALEQLYSKDMLKAKCVTVGGLPEKIKNKIKHKEKFIHLGYVPTAELENLYKNAELFIYPSLGEGFGMPPLEALKYGTKVAASSVTAVPEICGDSVFYFNPYNVDEMATRIYQAVNSENLPNDYFLKTSKRQEEDLKRLVEDIKKGFK